jgi:phage terminase large subunit
VPEKLIPLITKPKPLKIAVGGRGSGKTISFSDCFLKFCDDGEKVICAREFQNSIEESVHSSMIRRIQEHDIPTLHPLAKNITSDNRGKIVYLGLARNLGSVKSFDGANKVWIEEGQYISQESIDLLFPTIRENGSEIWVSMNRGSSKDPISKSFLSVAEKELARTGYYEDDYMIIVDINYMDNPWFPEKLEIQRKRDFELMSRAKYDHIWGGKYSDTVDNAIIEPEWFDACVDSHKALGFEPVGAEKVSYDPADSGDAKAIAYCHGVVFLDVIDTQDGRIDTATDWAISYALEKRVEGFIYDADGIGGGLKSQIEHGFQGKSISVSQFKGSEGPKNPDSTYDGEGNTKTNKQMFSNKRAQAYWLLRDRMLKTYQAVNGKYSDPDDLISFSSEIQNLDLLRAEICRIPRKYVNSGRIQLMTKQEMKSQLKLDSPNMADAVAMQMLHTVDQESGNYEPIEYESW